MELTYGGAITMPRNFVPVTEDEMEYIDGGAAWSPGRCFKNVWGFVTNFDTVWSIVTKLGLVSNIKAIATAGKSMALYVVGKLGAYAACMFGLFGFLIACAGTSYAVFKLGTERYFY